MTPRAKPTATATRLRRLAVTLLLAAAAVSGLAPGVPDQPGNAAAATEMPSSLRKYLPGTAEWARASWTAEGACAARGGDVSRWVSSLVSDTTVLSRRFMPGIFGPEQPEPGRARRDSILAGYARLGSVAASAVPPGYCAADLAGWSGTAGDAQQPFGIRWRRGADDGGARSRFSCAPENPADAGAELLIGADLAMCEGFFVRCPNLAGGDAQRCALWNDFSAAYVREMDRLRTAAIAAHPAQVQYAARETALTGAGVAFLAATALLAVAALVLVVRTRRSRRGAGTRSV
ncbi:hypothetical protein [Amycolatopsis sp. VC5-11]|uniref:hypothetical protein n=1 Tax=Amycolatopsis sp. VC5-11 TaxID=3120156 RepID=UPI0030080D61